MQTVIVERDIDQDRFITYEQFKLLLRQWSTLSKNQVYFMLLGVTGWRPVELCRAKVEDIDAANKRIKWRIAKPKQFLKDDYLVKKHKIKWRVLPDWAFRILDTYIKRNYLTMEEGYIFPSRDNNHGKHMLVKSFEAELKRKRDELFFADPNKWGWVKQPYQKIIYPDGRVQQYYKVSLYAFRKMHATYYAQMLQDKGITDVLLHTAVHMGHSKVQTTYQYVKSLIDEKKMSAGWNNAIEFSLNPFTPKIDKKQRKIADFFNNRNI